MHIRAQRRTHYRHRTRARVLSAYAHGRCTDNFARVHPWKRELRRGVRESLCFTTVYVHPANSVAMRAVARARQPDTHTHTPSLFSLLAHSLAHRSGLLAKPRRLSIDREILSGERFDVPRRSLFERVFSQVADQADSFRCESTVFRLTVPDPMVIGRRIVSRVQSETILLIFLSFLFFFFFFFFFFLPKRVNISAV